MRSENEPNEFKEEIDWVHERRKTLRRLLPLINDLVRDKADAYREAAEQESRITPAQIRQENLLKLLIEIHHLTVADESCNERIPYWNYKSHKDVGKSLPGYSDMLPGCIVKYEKDKYDLDLPGIDNPNEEDWVYVTQPFIADNLLGQVLQRVTVRLAEEEEIQGP